jgi:hypothetical protein
MMKMKMMNKKLNESMHAVCYAVNIERLHLFVVPFADLKVCQYVVSNTAGDGDPYQWGRWECLNPSEANDYIVNALNGYSSEIHDALRLLHELTPVTAADVEEYGIRLEDDSYDIERSFEPSLLDVNLYNLQKDRNKYDLDESIMKSKIYSHDDDDDLDEEETDESYVSGDGGYGGDSSDVIESEGDDDWDDDDEEPPVACFAVYHADAIMIVAFADEAYAKHIIQTCGPDGNGDRFEFCPMTEINDWVVDTCSNDYNDKRYNISDVLRSVHHLSPLTPKANNRLPYESKDDLFDMARETDYGLSIGLYGDNDEFDDPDADLDESANSASIWYATFSNNVDCFYAFAFDDQQFAQQMIDQSVDFDGGGPWELISQSQINDWVETVIDEVEEGMGDVLSREAKFKAFKEVHNLPVLTAEWFDGQPYQNLNDIITNSEDSSMFFSIDLDDLEDDIDESLDLTEEDNRVTCYATLESMDSMYIVPFDDEALCKECIEKSESFEFRPVAGTTAMFGSFTDEMISVFADRDLSRLLNAVHKTKTFTRETYEEYLAKYGSFEMLDLEWTPYMCVIKVNQYQNKDYDLDESLRLTEDDFVIPRNMSKSLARELEPHPEGDEADDDGDDDHDHESQAYIDRLRTLAGMNKV